MNKRMLMFASATLLAFAVSGPAMAQKKTLAVVVKGLDNPFFTVLGNGCALWSKGKSELRIHLSVHRPRVRVPTKPAKSTRRRLDQ